MILITANKIESDYLCAQTVDSNLPLHRTHHVLINVHTSLPRHTLWHVFKQW